MTMFEQATSYATRENAMKKLTAELSRIGKTPEDVHYLIVATSAGRFVPAVAADGKQEIVSLIHRNIGVF